MLTSIPSMTSGTGALIVDEYNSLKIPYSLDSEFEIPVNIYVTSQMYAFWSAVRPYLPAKATIAKAYVRPEDQAKKGLELLKSKNAGFDFDSIAAKDTTTPSKPSTSSDFFSKVPAQSTTAVNVSTVTKSHPGLDGKFGKYYLFQFDYNAVKTKLLALGVIWELPYADDYQKGYLFDIDVSKSTIDSASLHTFINTIVTTNDLNVSTCILDGTTIRIRFKTSDVYKFISEYAVLNIGPSSNVTDCFSQTIVQKIYKHLKDNGYGNLEETLPASALRGLPNNAKRKGTSLAIALKDSLIDVLGGSEGLLSNMQANTNEYLMGIINGLLAANSVVYDELDRIGGGAVKQKALEAFESGISRLTVSKGVKSLLQNGTELNNTTGRAIISKEDVNVVTANIDNIKKDIGLAKTQASS